MEPFVGNDYRKRVLAAVERRGGPDASDSFELYDLPLDEAERLADDAVSQRLDEVWAFWQKHRDHPKYRILVARLVAEHDARSAPLRHKTGRIAEARAARTGRELRDQERFELLDNAIARLNERYGGIPASKRAGLDDIGSMGGLAPDEIARRLRRHRIIDDTDVETPPPPPPVPSLTSRQRSQIAELLAEFDRLHDDHPTPTLFALLHLDTDDTADRGLITSRAAALNERARELPAGRFRAVIDELLVHVHSVLLAETALAEEYRRSMIEEVTEYLRPRVRAAVLVEDELGADDHGFLLEDAQRRGLGRRDARAVIAGLADDAGATVQPTSSGGHHTPDPLPVGTRERLWDSGLRAARAALRDGRPVRAQEAVDDARRAAGDDPAASRQVAAVADEIDRVLRRAAGDYRRALALAGDRRFVAALELFEALGREARDIDLVVPGNMSLADHLERARQIVGAADELAGASRADATPLLEMQGRIADHEELNSAAAGYAIDPPRNPRVLSAAGATTVQWDPSSTPSAVYRVVRIGADGSSRTLGRTSSTELTDGTPAEHTPPVYEVTAVVGGRHSAPARTDAGRPGVATSPTAAAPEPAPSDPPPISAVRVEGDTIRFEWPDGVTEAMVVIRTDAAPSDPADPRATASKVTNTRYQIDGGVPMSTNIPRPCHVAVASCRRTPAGALVVASAFGRSARAQAPARDC